MQKYILFFYTSTVLSLYAMENYQSWPQFVIGDIHNDIVQLSPFITQLSQQLSTHTFHGLSEEDYLSHQSPLLKQVHSQAYLNNIEKHPSIMLSAITNTLLPALYPNMYSRTYFDLMLKECATTVVAMELLINQCNNKKKSLPHYTISLAEGYSFAGYAEGNHGHAYAAIPLAATYALNTQLMEKILVIDENIDTTQQNIIDDYYKHGNGSIFSSNNYLNDKVITHDKIPDKNIWNFLSQNKQSLLALYNINIENFAENINKRTTRILSLFHHYVPTLFILSGDKNKYKNVACATINDITQTAIEYCTNNSSQQSSDQTESEDDSDYNNILAFKITTDQNNTREYDGTNFIYLATEIIIDNGIMEVELHEYYSAYGGYRYHSPTSSTDDSESDDEYEYNEEEEI